MRGNHPCMTVPWDRFDNSFFVNLIIKGVIVCICQNLPTIFCEFDGSAVIADEGKEDAACVVIGLPQKS